MLNQIINNRAKAHIPDDRSFKEAFPDYTDWYIIWYKEAEKLSMEFAAQGLPDTARAVIDIIQDNLSSSWHDEDRYIILANLTNTYIIQC